jgi:carbonic anhydrase/acetyltransferase-like protein (isoleucine patch superfamily)
MANIRPYKGIQPQIHDSAWVDETAVVIGDVSIGEESSIWPMTVVRGDVQGISIGHHTNIQDGSVLHVAHEHALSKPGGIPLVIGNYVTTGHKVLLHACSIGDYCLIGMGSIVMDDVTVEDYVMIGAGSVVTPGKTLASGYLYLGNPARQVRILTEIETAFLDYAANHYVKVKNEHIASSVL